MNSNFNDPNFAPRDSLGRKIGILNDFAIYTDQTLAFMKQDLDLFMNLTDLAFCRSYFAGNLQRNISINELYLLDGIIKGRSSLPQNKAIINIFASDKEIISTYNDLIEKSDYVYGKTNAPLSVKPLADVAPEYMKKIGRASETYDRRALRTLSFENSKNIFSEYDILASENPNIPAEGALLLLTPTLADATKQDYIYAVNALFEKYTANEYIKAARQIDSRGVLAAISEIADGADIDLASLPNIVQPVELSALASEYHGRFITVVNDIKVFEIIAAASELGLRATYFSKAVNNGKFFLRHGLNVTNVMDTALIRFLASSVYSSDFELFDEDEVSADRSAILVNTANGTQKLSYGDIVCFENRLYSAVSEKISRSPFRCSVNAFIDSLLPMVACGVKRDNISISVQYDFSNSSADGRMVSSVLGIYRSAVELCIANNASVSFSNNEACSVSCIAHGKIPERAIPSRFTNPSGYVYYISFERTEDGMPDFKGLRGMLDFAEELIESGKAISMRAVNSSINDTIVLMNKDFDFSYTSEGLELCDKSTRGFIVESAEALDLGVLIGSNKPNLPPEASDIPPVNEE